MSRKHESQAGLICGFEEYVCDRPARKRGYCNSHYTWHHRNNPNPSGKVCTVPGCGKPHRGRGYCVTHYSSMYQKNKEALFEEGDNFDYEDFWLFVKRELKL